MKKQWLAILTVLCLMVTMVAPTAFAEEATEGEDSTTTVTRIEAESLIVDQSAGAYEVIYTAGFTPDDGESANMVSITNNQDANNRAILSFGQVDLTNLVEVRVASASPNICLYTFCTGTKDAIATRFAAVRTTANSSGDWSTIKTFSADVVADVTGEQELLVKVTSNGNDPCGYLDYIELVYDTAPDTTEDPYTVRVECENWDKTQSIVSSNAKTNINANASGGKFLDHTSPKDIVFLGYIMPRSLSSVTVCVGNQNTDGVPYGIYVGGTAANLGTKIATVTGAKTSSWANYTPFTASVDAEAMAEVTANSLPLFLKVESTSGNGGNIDYVDLVYNDSVITKRIEMEHYDKSQSTTKAYVSSADRKNIDGTNGQISLSSGLQWLDALKQGNIVCLGKHDLTGLHSINVAIANSNTGLTHEFYIDGTQHALGTKIAQVDSPCASGWYAFTPTTGSVDVPEAKVEGEHMLFMKVGQNTSGSGDTTNGGNADYVDLLFDAPEEIDNTVRIEVESYDNSRSSKPYGGCDVKGDHISYFYKDSVLYLGEYDLTDLQYFNVSCAMSNSTTHTIQLWMDGTATNLGTMIAETGNIYSTGSWDTYKENKGQVAVDREALVGKHALYVKAVASKDDICSDTDYIDLVFPSGNDPFYTDYNFSAAANKDKSTSSGLSFSPTKVNNTTADTITLAYDDVNFTNLKEINITHAPADHSTLQLYKDAVEESALLGTYTLDGTIITSEPWYDNSNLRTQPIVLTDNELLTGKGTLYMVITEDTTRKHIGDFFDFSLYYEPDVLVPIPQYLEEAENYVWAISNECDPTTTNGVGHINNACGDDIFYLGKADLGKLTNIVIRTAVNAGSVSYSLYADMNVNYASMTENNQNSRRYTGTATGGTLIDEMPIADTGDWQKYSTYSFQNNSGLTGEHEIYLKLNQATNYYAGNIDYIRFVGVDELDISSNWPADQVSISFIGKYNEPISTGIATTVDEVDALLKNTKAPTIPGFIFKGWFDDRSAEEIYTTHRYSSVSITAVYVPDTQNTYKPQLGADFTAVDGTGNPVTAGTALTFDSRVKVTAEPGKEVAYWVLDRAKVGFGQTSYTFYISGNNNIDVVYADEVNETVTSSIVLQQSILTYNESAYTFSVVAQSSIVAGDSVSEYGVIYAASIEALDAVRSGKTANTVTVKSSKTAAGAQYIAHLLQVKADRTRFAMAYAVINDGVNGDVTVYSNQYATVTTPEIIPTDGSEIIPTIDEFQQ